MAAARTTTGNGAFNSSAMMATDKPSKRWSIINLDFSVKVCAATSALNNAIGIKALTL